MSDPVRGAVRSIMTLMDSRSTLRYPVELAAVVSLGRTVFSCSIRNLSLGGIFVRGPSLAIDTKAHVRFGGPQLPEIDVSCTARWNTDEGTGLRFDGLRAVDTYMLAKFIRAARSTASVPIPTDAVLALS